MNKLFSNKKAASVDNFFAIIAFFGLAIFFLVLMVAWNQFASVDVLWTGSSVGGEIKANAQNAVNQYDFMSLMAYFGIHLGILVLAYLLRTHPVIYVAAFILTAILALIAAPISNAYEDIILEPELSTAASSLPKTNFILSHLPKLEIIWAIITMIVMLGLARREGFI